MWIIRRLLFTLTVLILISAVIFTLTHVVPGSPATIFLGSDATKEAIETFEQKWGLDQPLHVQYFLWMKGIISRGDFGSSYVSEQSITLELIKTLPITLEIVILAFLFSLSISIPLGILSALCEDHAIDHFARVFAIIGISIPGFWMGLMLIRLVAVGLRILPPGGFVPISTGLVLHLKSVAMPAFSLGIYYTAILSRMTRSSMVEVLGQDYIRTARAMGLPHWKILVYALKNALVPVVSVSAMSFGYMFGWALIIEQVFNIAGLSRALLTAIFQRDYYMVQGIVLIITIIFMMANFAADILYRFLNPKIRETGL